MYAYTYIGMYEISQIKSAKAVEIDQCLKKGVTPNKMKNNFAFKDQTHSEMTIVCIFI